jgi:CheY-like chemotaxis protein
VARNSYNIIVADDEQADLDSVTELLSELAHKFGDQVQVLPATCGTDVIRILSRTPIDALFLDYHFKAGMSGDDIIDRIDDPFALKVIIVMSARGRGELEGMVIKRYHHLGDRFRFLRKPFDYLEIEAKYLEMKKLLEGLPCPFPIAYPIQALNATDTDQSRLTAVKDIIESLAKFSAAVLTADIQNQVPTDEVEIGINPALGLTLGAWLKWLRCLVEWMQERGTAAFMPELLQVFAPAEGGGPGPFEKLYKFKDEVRDRELGHGYAKEKEWYANLLKEHEPYVLAFCARYSFTSRYVMFVVEDMMIDDERNDAFAYKARVLMGAESRFSIKSFRSKLRLRREEVYLLSPSGAALSLNPIVIYRVCNSCSLGRVYMLDSISGARLSYNSYCNHRLDLKIHGLQNKYPYLVAPAEQPG